MSVHWYCRIRGQVLGPLTAQDVRKLAEEGRLGAVDLVRKTETGKWVPAGAVKGLTFSRAGNGAGRCPVCDSRLAAAGPCLRCQPGPAADPEEEDGEGYGLAEPIEPVSAPKRRRLRAPGPIADFAAGAAGVVAACATGWVGWWDPDSGELLGEWQGPAGVTATVAVSPRSPRAVVAVELKSGLLGTGRETRLLLARPDRDALTPLDTVPVALRALAMHPDGREVAAVDSRGGVRFWNPGDRKRADGLTVKADVYEFRLDAGQLAAGDSKGNVAVWPLAGGGPDVELTRGSQGKPACPCAPRALSVSARGGRLLTCSGKFFQRQYKDKVLVGFMVGDVPGAVFAAIMEANEESQIRAEIASVTSLRCWDLEEGELIMDWPSLVDDHPESICGAALSPDGSRVLTAGNDGSVRAWAIPGGGHSGVVFTSERYVARKAPQLDSSGFTGSWIKRVAFSADGNQALVLVHGDRDLNAVPWPASVC